jgi:hypothetical protein
MPGRPPFRGLRNRALFSTIRSAKAICDGLVLHALGLDLLASIPPASAGPAVDPDHTARGRVAHPLRHQAKVLVSLVRQRCGSTLLSCATRLGHGNTPRGQALRPPLEPKHVGGTATRSRNQPCSGAVSARPGCVVSITVIRSQTPARKRSHGSPPGRARPRCAGGSGHAPAPRPSGSPQRITPIRGTEINNNHYHICPSSPACARQSKAASRGLIPCY